METFVEKVRREAKARGDRINRVYESPVNRPLAKVRKTRLKAVFNTMMHRCYRETNPAYSRYGGRGIYVCKLWYGDWRAFSKWALEQGWRQGLTVDRIDNDGPYAPENCQLLSRAEHGRKSISEQVR